MRYMFATVLRLIVLLGLLRCAVLHAAPMYWDTSPDAGLQAGNGQWDLGTTASWSDNIDGSSPLLNWTSSANDAIFQASGTSLVTVFGTNVGANSIVFNSTGYTIGSQRVAVGAGGIVANESATMQGVTLGASQSVTVADGKTLTLGNMISYGNGIEWIKDGDGTLSTAHLYVGNTAGTTGTFTVEEGTLDVNGHLILGAIVDNSTGILNVSGGEINVSSVMYLGHIGNGTVNQTGGSVNLGHSQGMRVCTDRTDTTGIYNLDGGILRTRDIGTNTKDPDDRTMLLSFGGGTLEYTATGLMTPATQFEFKAGGGTISIPNANATMHVTQEIIGTGTGQLTKTGPGTLIVEEGAFGGVELLGGELVKDGAGTLTVTDAALGTIAMRVGSGGAYTHKDGTLNITSSSHAFRIAGDTTMTQEGGTINATGFLILGRGETGDTPGTATYDMTDGTLNVSRQIYIGYNTKAVFNQSGGNVVATGMRLADFTGGLDSEYNLSGGSLTVNGLTSVGFRNNVEFHQTGGTASFRDVVIGGGGGASSVGDTATYTLTDGDMTIGNGFSLSVGLDRGFTGRLNVHGGTITANGNLFVGNATANDGSATGVVTQTGGQVTIASDRALSFRATDGHTATYHLNGGTLTLAAINYTDTSTQQFNFGGGTLQANGSLNNDMPMTIHAGGATIDTQAHNVTLDGALSGDGKLTKLGDGTLFLTGPNSHDGGTTVSAGTLWGDTTSLQGDILNNAALVFDQATDGIYAGTLSGSGTLTKTGPGALTLMEGTIGSLDFDQGELIKDGPGTLMIGNGGLRVGAGRTYTHKAGTLNNASFIHSMRVAGTATVVQEGGTINSTGHIVLGEGTGTATYEMTGGELNVTSGVFAGWHRHGIFNHSGGTVSMPTLRVADSVGSADSRYNLSGGGSLTVTGTATVAFRDDAQFNQTGGTALFRYLNIGGSGTNPKVGTGEYTLSGGEATIRSDGWLSVGHDYGYTAKINIQGGTLLANGNVFIGNVTGNNGGATGTITQTGGQVTIAPDRALSFRAAGTHTAAYHLNGGTLTLAAIQYTDTSTQQFHFGGGTLQANGNLNTGMPMTIHAGGATIDTQSNTVTLGGELSGNGGLAKLGDGVLALNGENTYDGTTNIHAGTLRLGHASALGSTAGGTVIHADGTLDLNGQSIQGEAITVAGTITNTGAMQLHALRNVTLAGDAIFTGTGRWDIRGAGGPLNLEGFTAEKTGNDWVSLVDISINGPGGITVNQGTLGLTRSTWTNGTLTVNSSGTAQFQSNNAGNHSYSMDIVMAGGTIRSDVGVGTVHGAIELTGSTTFRVDTDSLTATGDISGAGSLTKTGGGTLVLSGENTYTGGTTVSVGTLRGNTTSLQGNIVNNSTLVFDQTADGIFAGAITGTGGLTKLGGGTLTLTGSNNYSGGTTVSDGILRGDTTSLRNNILNNATVIFDQATDGSFGGALSGSGGLVKLGDGALTLSGANTYVGGTTVAGGFLQVNNDSRLGAVPGTPTVNLTLDGGGLKNTSFAVALDANRTILLSDGGGWFTPGWSQSITLNGQVTGVGDLTANNDNGWLILANPANDYSGNTVIGGTLPGAAYNNARLRVGASEVIPHGAGKGGLVFNASAGGTATLDLNGHTETVNSLTSVGSGASVIDNSTGNGTLRVAGGNFPGIIRNTGGTLALEKIGDGTLTLSGNNTYAGGTTVAGGTLMVENASGSGTGSGPVDVGPVSPGIDAILGGTGSIAGTVTIHTGGMHAPGASVGEQTIGGAVWNSGGVFQFEINDAMGVAGGGVDGLGWDLVTIDDGAGTGKLDLTGLTAADPFEIHAVSLDGTLPGEIMNFNPTVPYDWVFVTYDELVDDYFHPNLFAFNAGGFENGIGAGHFAVTQVPGGLAVSFVPEPGTLLMALAALVLLTYRRRRGAGGRRMLHFGTGFRNR